MALQVSQSIVAAGTTPAPITPTASDTIAASSFGDQGVAMRVITTGTATTATVLDPGRSPISNPGTPAGVVCPSTGARMILIPRGAIDPANSRATVTFTGALTGVTYELYRY